MLTDFIKQIKSEYTVINEKSHEGIIPILDELGIQYEKMKRRLYNNVYSS